MKDISEAVADAARFDASLIAGLRAAVAHVTVQVAFKARSEHRWKDRTGTTRASITRAIVNTRRGATGIVKAGENAARLNFGTRAHRIEARNVRFLKFEQNGQTVFRRSVWHPGTRPDPFLDSAAAFAKNELERAVNAVVVEALK